MFLIFAPKGRIASMASLKCCRPKGIPIIVMQKMAPITRWARHSSHPKSRIQRMLPIKPQAPKSPTTTSLPNGQRTKPANLKHCRPKGIPIIVRQTNSPAIAQNMASRIPPSNSHMILPIKLNNIHPGSVKSFAFDFYILYDLRRVVSLFPVKH